MIFVVGTGIVSWVSSMMMMMMLPARTYVLPVVLRVDQLSPLLLLPSIDRDNNNVASCTCIDISSI